MKVQKFTKSYVKYGIVLVGLAILLIILLSRSSPPGTESYLNTRLAEAPGFYDELSFGGRFAAYSWGTPLVLSVAPNILSNFLPLLLGLLSIFVFSRIVKKFTEDIMLQNVVLALYVLSPTFIYLFSSANNLFIPFFLSLVAFSLYCTKQWKWFTIPIILIMPVFSIVLTTVLLLSIVCYSMFNDKGKKGVLLSLILVGLFVSLVYYGFMIYQAGLPGVAIAEEAGEFEIFAKILYDLGSLYGLGTFIFILGIIGLMNRWDKKYENLFALSAILSLGVLSLVWQETLILLNLFVVYFAGIGLVGLLNRKWTSPKFRKFTVYIILLGVMFSCLSQVATLVRAEPDQAMIEGFSFLESQEKGVVFSHYSRGVWIAYAGHKNVMDENLFYIEDLGERLADVETLYYSRDLEETMAIVDKYDINYIWVDSGFKRDVWEYDGQGLLFIAEYTKSFNKIYEKEGVEIWRIEE